LFSCYKINFIEPKSFLARRRDQQHVFYEQQPTLGIAPSQFLF